MYRSLLPTARRLREKALLKHSVFRSQSLKDSNACNRELPYAIDGARGMAAAPAVEMMEVTVNDVPVQIPKGVTVLRACDEAGIEIPRFCYHERLSIAGNCRMCLVEVEKSPKPVASCAMPAMPGMKIKTNTPLVKKAREGVMEFLLLNHPLDCPICDQGGECDLQDQAMTFGSDRGRFTEYKRSVVDKNLGPLVKTVMTRCIHCTRCVRYAKEIAGVEDLGVTGRGRDSEIGTYIERMLTSEVSGNVIDLCPVGALTSKPFAFTARNWELKSTESIDVSDSLGASIRIDSRGSEVMRVVPRLNEEVNEEWITDKARFAYDGLKRQRLAVPMVRDAETGRLKESTWPEALAVAAEALQKASPDAMVAVAGKLSEAESTIALKDLMASFGCYKLSCEGVDPDLEADVRSGYLLNTGIANIEDADVALLVGTDPRVESPLINIRLRKAVTSGKLKVASIGPSLDLTYPHEELGEGTETLVQMAEGRHPFCTRLANAKRPLLLVGAGVLKRPDRDTVLAALHTITELGGVVKEGWNGYNVLHLSASRVGGLDLGFVPGPKAFIDKTPAKFVYLLGADDVSKDSFDKDAFIVYQGHHGDRGASIASVVLPGTAYTEKEGTYVNTEGRVQQTRPAVPSVGNARDDWKILRALSEMAGKTLPYDNVDQVRKRLADVAPHLTHIDEVEPATWRNGDSFGHRQVGTLRSSPFTKTITNFYLTDAIARASQTMAKCVAAQEKMSKVQLQ